MTAYSPAVLDRVADPRFEGPLPDPTHAGVAGSPVLLFAAAMLGYSVWPWLTTRRRPRTCGQPR